MLLCTRLIFQNIVCCFLLLCCGVSFAIAAPPRLEVKVDKPVIRAGETVTLTWETEGAKYCQMSHGIGLLKRSGTLELQPSQTTTYTMTAFGFKWNSGLDDAAKKQNEMTLNVQIRVEGVKPAVSFAASSLSIYEGDSIDLSWTVDHADRVDINQGIGAVESKGSRAVTPKATTEYRLTAVGPGGTEVSTVTVKVNPRASSK